MKKKFSDYSIGDKILVKYKENLKDDTTIEKEGFFIPRPDYYDDNTFVFKLKSGYNIGIDSEKIIEIKLIEEYDNNKNEINTKEEKTNKEKRNINERYDKKICIIGLGGTIASKVDYRTGGVVANLKNEDLFDLLPSLKKYNVDVDIVMNEMSENFNDEIYKKIAKSVEQKIKEGYQGLILMHGTDTLHYTSSILNFMLRNLKIPIIITGSQRSIDRGSSDAFLNLELSCKALNYIDFGKVLVGFHENESDDSIILINGTKTRKMHSSKRDAFKPINDLPIARITREKIELIDKEKYYFDNEIIKSKKQTEEEFFVDDKLSNKVAILYFFPNIDPKIIDLMYEIGYRVFVVMGTGLGHVESNDFLDKISSYKDKAIFFMATQTIYGRTNEFVYSNLRKASKSLIYLGDMIPETIFCKAKVFYEKDNFLENMKKNFADEILDDKD